MKLSSISLVLLRLVVGCLFFSIGLSKLMAGWITTAGPLVQSLTEFQHNASGIQLWYLGNIAIPYAGLWSKLIACGEFAIGISLVIGLLTRLSAATAIVMLLNLHLASGLLFTWDFFQSSSGSLLMVTTLILLYSRAGREFGVDAMLAQSDANGILW